ncbi:hypothetical protein [Nocardia sp. SC052]|uniref:hypothetical protein n=1 Tax=Nocardia sichangensis TaxID=3385975 RepID=UPI0039A25832
MASTPRPRPRSDGSVAWQVYFYYRDTDRKRRQSSETFEEYAEAQWWAELIDKVGVEEALKVLAAKRDIGSDVILQLVAAARPLRASHPRCLRRPCPSPPSANGFDPFKYKF